jgi:pyridoxamine 5'-phosphate oxidase
MQHRELDETGSSIHADARGLAPWRSPLARALHRNRSRPDARYLQLATVNAQGRPDNRTVVFRGFMDGNNDLKMITDRRSQKVEQIQYQGWAAICWYFPITREQFRISGALRLVDDTAEQVGDRLAYQKTWQALSSSARQQFYWPSPGQPRVRESVELSCEDLELPAPNYCLLICVPERVDHLVLQGEPHQRCQYEQDSLRNWEKHWVMP